MEEKREENSALYTRFLMEHHFSIPLAELLELNLPLHSFAVLASVIIVTLAFYATQLYEFFFL